MKRSKLLSTALVLSLSAGLLSACGAAEEGASTSVDTSPDAIIKIANSADVVSFDPHNHNDSASAIATRHIYSNLTVLDEETGEFVGDLAESFEFVDDITCAFKLKEGVKYHNGADLTSEDVKFSLERQKESSRVGHLVTMIKDIEIVDDYNFNIILEEPSSALISSLAHAGGAIFDKDTVEETEAAGETVEANPNGTGPYVFESWNPGDNYTLVRYDDYFGENALNGGLEVRVITEESSRTIALETGEVDILATVGLTDAQRIRETEGIELVEYTSTQIEYLAFNSSVAPFDDVKVRQAISHAINKDDVIAVGVSGEGVPNSSYLGAGAKGYSADVTEYEYDLDKAKALLEEAGYNNDLTFNIMVRSDQASREAQVIQASLAEIGVTVTIEQMDSAVFLERTGNGEHEAAILGWFANAEPDNTFRPLFHSNTLAAGGNRAFVSNEEVDALIDEAAQVHDYDVRQECYDEALKLLTEDAYFAPFFTTNGMIAKNSNVEGEQASTIGMHNFYGAHFVAE